MTRPGFSAGDAAPWFVCRSTNNPNFHFDTAAGRYIVLCFFGSMAGEKSAAALRFATTALRQRFDDANVSFFGVSIDPEDERQGRARQMEPGIRHFWDFDGKVSRLFGALG
jgi:peroxiredoxin